MSFTGGALFIAFSIPIIFFLIVWFVVTIARIYFPEKRIPFDRSASFHDDGNMGQHGKDVVGVHQIRSRQRELANGSQAEQVFYEPGMPESIPDSWKEDLLDRKN